MKLSLRRAVQDVRLLGGSAPLRAAYEASKRVGGHDVVFGRLVRSRRATPPLKAPFLVPPQVPAPAQRRALEEAASIEGGTVKVFSRPIPLPETPDWHAMLEREGSWPRVPWWRIDIRSEARGADVKWCWELARHRHLVVLARAASLEDGSVALRRLEAQLRSWLEQNPPEVGIHWYSNLELALRSIAWLQVLALVGDALPTDLRKDMAAALYHSGRHLVADVPYTVSSMRNNHLLGDALGLIVLGRAFPDDPAARRWVALGDRMFQRQAAVLVRPDGSMLEDSLSYQRFVTEMLAVRVLVDGAPPAVHDRLASAGQFFARLGVLAGPVPQYGDWDEGRVLAGPDPFDLVGTTRLALALTGSGAPAEWREESDEVAWYCSEGEPRRPEPPERGGRDVGGSIGRAELGDFTVWLKAGSGPSHGHADLCSVAVSWKGRWIVGDPGTGAYNGPVEQRNYFRSSVAHSVLRVQGLDQLQPHRAFRWLHAARGWIGPPLRFADGVVVWGWHDAYRRLQPPRRVARAVLVRTEGVMVVDWVEGTPVPYRLSLPLAPGVGWDDGRVTLDEGPSLVLSLPTSPRASDGDDDPYSGWWSPTYGSTERAVRLEVVGESAGAVVWCLSGGETGPPTVDGAAASWGAATVSADFKPGLVAVRLVADGREQVALSRDK